MQSLKIVAAAGALALAARGGACAASGFQGQVKLAAPVGEVTRTVVNGVTWTCSGDSCAGEAASYDSLDNPVRECKRVAAALGPLTAYSARGREVTGGSLRVCNAEAKTAASAVAGKN